MIKSDKDMLMNDKPIDEALDFLDGGEDMTDEQIEAMASDEDVIEALGDLLEMKEAVISASPFTRINKDEEWLRFKAKKGIEKETEKKAEVRPVIDEDKKNPHHALLYILIGVAATLFVLFGFHWYKQVSKPAIPGDIVLEAVDNTHHPVLTTDEGDEIVLDEAQRPDEELAEVGAKMDKNGGMVLSRNRDAKTGVLTLTIPRGQNYKVTLADGTEVWLNTDSKFSYPSKFTGGERRVSLQGEAYFKVKHDPQHPFIVEANGVETKVLGTEFNVRSYGKNHSQVTLIKGSVEVKSRDHRANRVKLVPGQEAKLNTDGSFDMAEVDIDSYVYWKEGFFYFDNVDLASIMQDIGRWYNLNVVFQNEQVKSYKMHFLADRKDGVQRVIKLLNSMGKMHVELVDNSLVIR